MNREPYLFAAQVAASSAVTLEREIKSDGTVVEMAVRLWDGPELDLQLEAFIEDPGGNRQSIVQYATGSGVKTYIDGNDDRFRYGPRLPVSRGSKLVVVATNANVTNAYDFSVKIEVDYALWAQRFS